MPKALVTGAGGFVGQWLCRALLARGWSVTGTTIGLTPAPGVLSVADLMQVQWRAMDLRPGVDRRTVFGLLERERPDAIFHLAAVSFVPTAGEDPLRALETNVSVTVRLLDALRHHRVAGTLDPFLLVIGSAEQYGRHEPADMPLRESHELRPRTFYAATKCAQESFALAAARADGSRVVATRSFNHSGPGQSKEFLLPAMVERVRRARSQPGLPVAIGNTEPIRDFLHVEDVAAAYIALMERGRAGEVYNVCSGDGGSVGEIAAEILAQAGVVGPLTTDAALRRPVDVPILVGDAAKLRTDTGWKPLRSRADIIADLLNAAS